MTQLYKKKGRRYHPIGYSDNFTGFPTEGIWAVYSGTGVKTQSCIAQVGQFQSIDYSILASLIKEKGDECKKAVTAKGSCTVSEIVDTVFKTILNESR